MSKFLTDANDLVFHTEKTVTKDGVPGPIESEEALAQLAILPNPNHPEVKNPEKFVESPWAIVPPPTVDPWVWDNATLTIVTIKDLLATDPYMKRKKIKEHIETMGGATTPFRNFAMVIVINDELIIMDGHHRLMAMWLLGMETAPVWLVKEK